AVFLWAFLPPLLIAGLEKTALGTSYFGSMLRYRLMGHMETAFAPGADWRIDSMAQLTPTRFLGTPGLWIGLLFAAGFLAAAVHLGRDQGTIWSAVPQVAICVTGANRRAVRTTGSGGVAPLRCDECGRGGGHTLGLCE